MTNANEIIETIGNVTYKVSVSKFGYALTHQVDGGWRSVAQNARTVRRLVDQRVAKRVAEIRATL